MRVHTKLDPSWIVAVSDAKVLCLSQRKCWILSVCLSGLRCFPDAEEEDVWRTGRGQEGAADASYGGGGEDSWCRDLMHKKKEKSHCQGFPPLHSSAWFVGYFHSGKHFFDVFLNWFERWICHEAVDEETHFLCFRLYLYQFELCFLSDIPDFHDRRITWRQFLFQLRCHRVEAYCSRWTVLQSLKSLNLCVEAGLHQSAPTKPAALSLKAQSLANWWALIPAVCCSQWLSSVPEVKWFSLGGVVPLDGLNLNDIWWKEDEMFFLFWCSKRQFCWLTDDLHLPKITVQINDDGALFWSWHMMVIYERA